MPGTSWAVLSWGVFRYIVAVSKSDTSDANWKRFKCFVEEQFLGVILRNFVAESAKLKRMVICDSAVLVSLLVCVVLARLFSLRSPRPTASVVFAVPNGCLEVITWLPFDENTVGASPEPSFLFFGYLRRVWSTYGPILANFGQANLDGNRTD